MHTSTLFVVLGVFTVMGSAFAADNHEDRIWAAIGRDGVQRVNIQCGPNFLDPNHIVIKSNVPTEILVSTTPDLAAHSFVISLPGTRPINADVPLAATQKPFAFVPGRTGDYRIFCRDDVNAGSATLQKAKQGIVTVIP
jgi:hypothetical protein